MPWLTWIDGGQWGGAPPVSVLGVNGDNVVARLASGQVVVAWRHSPASGKQPSHAVAALPDDETFLAVGRDAVREVVCGAPAG